MVQIRYVSKAGNLMVARFDDDTQQTLYPTSGDYWLGTTAPVVVDPPPDPDPDPEPDPEPTPGDWVHPLPGSTMTSPYGPRDFDGFHYGVDYSTGTGTVGDPVLAPTDLRITVSADGNPNDFHFGTAGNHVKGHTLDGSHTFNFMHLSSRSCSVGDIVPKGSPVGVEGATGNVTGLHLHLEAYIGQFDNPGTPPYGDPVDPVPILRANGAPV